MAPPLRTHIFIDGQNLYRDARDAFHTKTDPSSFGQVDPRKYAQLIVAKNAANGVACDLQEIRLYTGFPTNEREPKAYAAHMKQRAFWLRNDVTVFPRPLQYPREYPKKPQREKGVDVELAVDVVTCGLLDKTYDLAVVASTDTDLVPALTVICRKQRAWGSPRVQVTIWAPLSKRLRVENWNMWCHHLDEADYESVRDRTNYTL
ncbi:MAG: NYN domain-containing protein [Actinomycetota bacterium]